jgi:uncharacterized membrane protein
LPAKQPAHAEKGSVVSFGCAMVPTHNACSICMQLWQLQGRCEHVQVYLVPSAWACLLGLLAALSVAVLVLAARTLTVSLQPPPSPVSPAEHPPAVMTASRTVLTTAMHTCGGKRDPAVVA